MPNHSPSPPPTAREGFSHAMLSQTFAVAPDEETITLWYDQVRDLLDEFDRTRYPLLATPSVSAEPGQPIQCPECAADAKAFVESYRAGLSSAAPDPAGTPGDEPCSCFVMQRPCLLKMSPGARMGPRTYCHEARQNAGTPEQSYLDNEILCPKCRAPNTVRELRERHACRVCGHPSGNIGTPVSAEPVPVEERLHQRLSELAGELNERCRAYDEQGVFLNRRIQALLVENTDAHATIRALRDALEAWRLTSHDAKRLREIAVKVGHSPDGVLLCSVADTIEAALTSSPGDPR